MILFVKSGIKLIYQRPRFPKSNGSSVLKHKLIRMRDALRLVISLTRTLYCPKNLFGESKVLFNVFLFRETVWRLWYKLLSEGNLVLWKDQKEPELELNVDSPKGIKYTMSNYGIYDILPYAATFSFYLTHPALRSDEDIIQISLESTWINSRTGKE